MSVVAKKSPAHGILQGAGPKGLSLSQRLLAASPKAGK
jgi:hypothetical protein